LEQLVDMFPQYDRADLLRELRERSSAEAYVSSIRSSRFITRIARTIVGGSRGGIHSGGFVYRNAAIAQMMRKNTQSLVTDWWDAAASMVVFLPWKEESVLAFLASCE
jgi:hypothetical protein